MVVLLKVMIGLLVPWGLGYALLAFMFRKTPLKIMLSSALAYGLGLGVLSQWMLILGMAGIRYSLSTIGLPLIILTLFFVFLTLKHKKQNILTPKSPTEDEKHEKLSLPEKLFYSAALVYITCTIFLVFWRALNVPVQSWDALLVIAFKAKVFFYDGLIHHLRLPHSAYPLHVPFAQAWMALNLGEWHDCLTKIIFPISFLSYLMIQYHFLRVLTDKKWAIAGVCLLISSNFFVYHATIAYMDFFMMYYNCTTIMLILLWSRKNADNDSLLILASLFAGFTTFIKSEGTAYLFIHLILITLILLRKKMMPIGERLKRMTQFAIPAFGICFTYHIYKAFLEISNHPVDGRTEISLSLNSFSRIPVIIHAFLENLISGGNWSIIWFILIMSILINFKRFKECPLIKWLAVSMGLFFGFYFTIFLVSKTFLWISGMHADVILSRVLLHFFPLSVLLIILLNYPEKKKVLSKITSTAQSYL